MYNRYMKKINICVDEKILSEVISLANEQGRTYSELIREAIIKLLRDYAK